MGILARYIVSEILKFLMPIWAFLGFLLFILEWLSQVFKAKGSTTTVLKLYAYKIPYHLQIVFPVAVLFSTLIVLGHMNRAREIVAAQSFGIKGRALLAPVLLAVSLASIANYWIIDFLAPWGMRKHYETQDVEVDHVPSRFSTIRQQKIWYRNKDILYNVRYFAPEKDELYDVTIYTFDEEFHIAQTIFASKAAWNGTSWSLTDGTVSVVDRRLESPVTESFKLRSTRLIEEPKSLKYYQLLSVTMGQAELAKAIKRNRSLGINTNVWEVLYHSRFSFFLISFVFLMLAFPMAMRFNRTGSFARDGVFVVTVSMIYWFMFSFSTGLGNAGKLNPIVAAWAPSLIFVTGIYFYIKTMDLKSHSA